MWDLDSHRAQAAGLQSALFWHPVKQPRMQTDDWPSADALSLTAVTTNTEDM